MDICYVISHGFAARMILHSDILMQLRDRGISVGLIVPNASEQNMLELANQTGATLIQAPKLDSKLLQEYATWLRRYLFEDVKSNPALWSWHLRLLDLPHNRIRNRIRAGLYMALNKLSLSFPSIRRRLSKLEERLFLQNEDVQAIIDQYNPRVVVSTYPVEILEACFLHAAQKSGSTTVSQLLSWDNITSKGRFSVNSDFYITWGPVMSAEVEEYYDIPQARIKACGVAHFDRHFTALDPKQSIQALTKLGLDPEKPYLFFGMSSPAITLYEIEVVEWLAEAVCKNTWGPDLQLVIRPHPQNVHGYTADASWLDRLNQLINNRVGVDYPSLQKSNLAWNMEKKDLPHLVNLIAGCAICLNSGSTLSIDALLHDKPVVLSLFDANRSLPWHRSIRRYFDIIHYKKLIEMGGLKATRTFDEFQEAISAYLQDPTLDAEGRERSRLQECGTSDGKASERIADVLSNIVDKKQPFIVVENPSISELVDA